MKTPLTPVDLVRRAADVYPRRTGVVDGDQAYTYAEHWDRCLRLAGALTRYGIRAGDRVAVLAPNCAELLVAFTGIPMAGAIIVPLNTRLARDEYAYILDNCEPSAVIVHDSLLQVVEPLKGCVASRPRWIVISQEPQPNDITFEEALADATPCETPITDEDDAISINYTSGTTGRPRGAVLTHRGEYLNALNFIVHLELTRHDVYLHTLPMFHVNGWGGVWAPAGMGCKQVSLPRPDPATVFDVIAREGVTALCAAPTVLVMLAEHAATHAVSVPSGVRVATGGSPPPPAVIREMEEELGFDVLHVYGMTELSPWTTVNEPERDSTLDRASSKARQGVRQLCVGDVRVVRQDGTPVLHDAREIGEIVVAGNTVMASYWRDHDATNAAIVDGYFHTGDLAVVHPDDQLEILDRAKDVIISGGENISSVEIEKVLYEHPDVREAAVIARAHPRWGERPVAFVAGDGLRKRPDLRSFLIERLARFKCPDRFLVLDDLPKTASGKIQKAELRSRFAEFEVLSTELDP